MRSMLITVLSVAASGVMASELDVQPGQWALHLNSTDAGYSANTGKAVFSTSETTNTTSDTTLSANISGEYGLTEKITLGGSGSFATTSVNSASETSGTQTSDDTEKVTIYQISPLIRFNVSETLAFQAEASYLGVPAVTETDLSGDETYVSDSGSLTNLWLGIVYRTDLRPNILMSFETFAGLLTQKTEAEEDPSDTSMEQYYQARVLMDFNYFLATNFSVNAGLTAHYRLLNAAEDDGIEADLSNVELSYLDYGTRFGFTYYHR